MMEGGSLPAEDRGEDHKNDQLTSESPLEWSGGDRDAFRGEDS
jgi:hypothetical protein